MNEHDLAVYAVVGAGCIVVAAVLLSIVLLFFYVCRKRGASGHSGAAAALLADPESVSINSATSKEGLLYGAPAQNTPSPIATAAEPRHAPKLKVCALIFLDLSLSQSCLRLARRANLFSLCNKL